MPAIEAPALETSMFPIGIGLLVVLCLAAPAHTWLRRAAAATAALMPIGILADLQWRLYEFGHTLNPTAPIRLKPFTPLVIGQTQMGNFVSTAMVSWGVACLVGAALLLWAGGRLERAPRRRAGACRMRAAPPPSPPCSCSPSCRPRRRRPRPLASSRRASTPRRAAARWSSPPASTPARSSSAVRCRSSREPGAIIDGGGSRQRRHHRRRRRRVSRIHGAQQRPRGDAGSRRHHRHRQPPPHRGEPRARRLLRHSHRRRPRRRRPGQHDRAGDVARRAARATASASGTWTTRRCSRNRISHARDGIYLSFTNRIIVAGNVVTRVALRAALDVLAGRALRGQRRRRQPARRGADDVGPPGAAAQPHPRSIARDPRPTACCSRTSAISSAEDNEILANRVGDLRRGGAGEPGEGGGLHAAT